MKFVIAFVLIGSVYSISPMDWCFKLGNYVCNKLYDQPVEGKRFPIVESLYEFDPLRDKHNKQYDISDSYEFDSVALAHKKYASLQTRSERLDFLNRHWWWISSKDVALLRFARAMAEHEKEWKLWHTSIKKVNNRTGEHFHRIALEINVNNAAGPFVKKISYREDVNSPFFKRGFITESMEAKYKGTLKLDVVNAYENMAYHDELKFLQTQQHKMELYWNIKPFWQKYLHRCQYDKQCELLKQEIANFKEEKNRTAFTRSCMQKNNFELVQEMRQEYKKWQTKEQTE